MAGGSRRRRVLVRSGVVLVVLVGLALAARLLVPAGMVRDLVAARLGEALGRPVTVGSARGGVLPRPWVELRDLAAAEGPDGVAFNVAELRLRLRWGPLLRRSVEIDRAEIVGPVANVRLVQADPARAPVAGARAAPAAAAAPVAIRIEHLQISGGSVNVSRVDGTPVAALRGLREDLALEASPDGDVAVVGTTHVDTLRLHLPQGTLGEGIPLTWTKDLRWEGAAGRLRIVTSELAVGDLPVAVTGEVEGLAGGSPVADLNLAGGPAELASLQGYLPSGLAPGLDGVRSRGTASLRAAIRGPLGAAPDTALAWELEFALSDGTIEHPALPAPVRDIALVVSARPGLVAVEKLTARTAGSSLAIHGEVNDPLADAAYRLTVAADVDLAEVTALRPPAAAAPALTGRATAQVTVTGRAADPASVGLVGPLGLTGVTISGPDLALPVTGLRARGRIDGRVLRLDELALRQGRSDYRLSGTVTDPLALVPPTGTGRPLTTAATATVDLAATSAVVDVDEMLATGRTAGRGRDPAATADVPQGSTARPAPPAALEHLRRLTGTVRARVDSLVLRGNPLTDVVGTVRLDRGLVMVETASARVYGGAASLSGTVDLAAPRGGRVELQMAVANARAERYFATTTAAGRFTRLASALVGSIDVDATLAGDLDDTLGLDLRTVSSEGRVAVHEAVLAGLPLQNELVTLLDAPQLQRIDVRDLLQPFRIDEGRLTLEGVAIRAGPVAIRGSGWQALDGELSARLDLTLPPDYAQGLRRQLPAQMADLLLDAEGSALQLPIRVTGRSNAPVVRLDMDGLAAAAAARAEAKLARETDRLKQQAIEEAARGLQDLLQLPPDSTAAGADSTGPQTLEEVGRSLLDRLRQGKKGGG